jgi:phage terminase large subunit-like protein
MSVHGTLAQVHSAGDMDLRVRLTDSDAKQVMVKTPNVIALIAGVSYPVYEVNPTVISDVYAVRLCRGLKNGAVGDTGVTFEV